MARQFAWADTDAVGYPFNNAACLTVVRGVSPSQALRLLVPHTRVTSRAQAERTIDKRRSGITQIVEAGSRNGWTFVLEDNNFLATFRRAVSKLSSHGQAAVTYFNVNFDNEYLYGIHGKLVRAFEPLGYADRSGRPLPQERGIPFGTRAGDFHFLALSMLLTQRLTGLRIRLSDLRPARYPLAVVTDL